MADRVKIPETGAYTLECVHSHYRAAPCRFDTFDQAKRYADDQPVIGDIFIVCHTLTQNQGDEGWRTSSHVDAQRIKGIWKMAGA